MQFISGITTNESDTIPWTRIAFDEEPFVGLEFELQARVNASEVQVHQRWGEDKPWRLIGTEEICEP